MALTTVGKSFLLQSAMGLKTIFFDEANSYIEVGDSSAAFEASQTSLLGTQKVRKPMNAGYPKVINPTQIQVQADFLESEANFTWNEWGWFNASIGGDMMLREVSSHGVKAEGKKWVLTATINII